ncbi:hypothetical protein THASP1DRAFT_21649, partial [Thamnocephalis sphaerospora]
RKKRKKRPPVQLLFGFLPITHPIMSGYPGYGPNATPQPPPAASAYPSPPAATYPPPPQHATAPVQPFPPSQDAYKEGEKHAYYQYAAAPGPVQTQQPYAMVMTPTEYDATIRPSGPNGQYTVEDYQKMAQARIPRFPVEQYGRCPKDGGEHHVRAEYANSSLCFLAMCGWCAPVCISQEMPGSTGTLVHG